MNHLTSRELLKKLETNLRLKRKFKIFLAAGLVGCFMISALFVWGGITVFKGVASVGTNPVVQEKILRLETEIQNAPALVKVGCWDTVKSLMNVESLLEKPIAENYNNIKAACLNE